MTQVLTGYHLVECLIFHPFFIVQLRTFMSNSGAMPIKMYCVMSARFDIIYYSKLIYLLILDIFFRYIFSKSLFLANREENFAFLYEYHVPCIHVAYCRRFHNCLAQILSRKDWKNSREVCKQKNKHPTIFCKIMFSYLKK